MWSGVRTQGFHSRDMVLQMPEEHASVEESSEKIALQEPLC